jgi:hypothetical protein
VRHTPTVAHKSSTLPTLGSMPRLLTDWAAVAGDRGAAPALAATSYDPARPPGYRRDRSRSRQDEVFGVAMNPVTSSPTLEVPLV